MSLPRRNSQTLFVTGFLIVFVCLEILLLQHHDYTCRNREDSQNKIVDRYHPFIFVGGMPRSGTTLMRVILDAHPDVRCGVETRVIPRFLHMYTRVTHSIMEARRLKAAGIFGQTLDGAMTAFLIEIMANNGHTATRICNKDPFALQHMTILGRLFPNAKFVLMLRDVRACLASVIRRNVTISNYKPDQPQSFYKLWNRSMERMWNACQILGPKRCRTQKYEDFVLQPRTSVKNITNFLDISYHPDMLNYWKLVKNKKIAVSLYEKSTNQVIKPIYLDSLHSWMKILPKQVAKMANWLTPMMRKLGYDMTNLPPRYGATDTWVPRLSRQNQEPA